MFQQIRLGDDYRLIAISDIHGNHDGFQRVLEKAKFDSTHDILVICGDMLEKGPEILKTLRLVMTLVETTHTYVVLGNCDAILTDIHSDTVYEEMHDYLRRQSRSIVHEMCAEIGFSLDEETDLHALYARLREAFQDEIRFVSQLPLAIETERFVFVHAGIEPRADYHHSAPDYMLCHDRFYEVEHVYPKTVVAGHWPVSYYAQDRVDASPVIDRRKNICCIDGGNNVTPFGQLNALIIEDKRGNMSLRHVAIDDFPRAILRTDQAGTQGRKIVWPYNALQVTHETETHLTGILKAYSTRGYVPDDFDREPVTIPRELTYRVDGQWYVHGCMYALLPLRAGDEVAIVLDAGGEQLICKHDGKVGLVSRKNLQME